MDQQIPFDLHQDKLRMRVAAVTRKMGNSKQTRLRWQNQLGAGALGGKEAPAL